MDIRPTRRQAGMDTGPGGAGMDTRPAGRWPADVRQTTRAQHDSRPTTETTWETVRVRPITDDVLVAELTDRIDGAGQRRLRVAVDGAPSAQPDRLADALVDPLRGRGRFALHVPSRGFWKAASLRLERGRTNPDAFYEDWLDTGALTREVLAPLAPGASGKILPSRWNPDTDRATRASYVDIPANGVVIVSGPMLLGTGLEFDVVVHLEQSPAALARRGDPAAAWTLPAYERYRDEVMPELLADVVVRVDDPRHPAVIENTDA